MTLELPLDPLPDGAVLVHAALVAEVIASDGEPMLVTRITDDVAAWQALGLVTAHADKLREQLRHGWHTNPNRDDDEDA